MTEQLPAQGRCPDCGAENALTATKCWMCGRTAWVASSSTTQLALASDIWQPETPADVREEPSFWVKHESMLALSALVIVVTAGVWLYEGVLGFLMVILIDLPFLITISASLIREGRHRSQLNQLKDLPAGAPRPAVTVRPMTGGEKVGTFLKWLAVMAGSVIFMAGVAIIVIAVAFISMITALAQMCGCTPK